MTDFGKPTTPGDALRQAAKEMKYREDRLRSDATKLLAQAEELQQARFDIEHDADRYDEYQPVDSHSAGSTDRGDGQEAASPAGEK